MNLNGSYVTHVLPICPAWPNAHQPATAEDAARANAWGGTAAICPCVWTHKEAAAYQLEGLAQPQAHAVIRVLQGQTVSSAAAAQKKMLQCHTHGTTASKTFVRESSFYYHVVRELNKWWTFTHVKVPNIAGYTTMKLVAMRKNLVDTMRKMW